MEQSHLHTTCKYLLTTKEKTTVSPLVCSVLAVYQSEKQVYALS